ncbi:MAG: phosphatase domain-containing protein [Bacteroidota bacterium]
MIKPFKKDPLQIIAFKTYGTQKHLYLKGRALEDEIIDLDNKGWVNILLNSWKRFETDEIRHTDLAVKLKNGLTINTKTDAEGYFFIDQPEVDVSNVVGFGEWLDYKVCYRSKKKTRKMQQNNEFYGRMLIPSKNAGFGVISDIDDTILHTGVTSKLKWRVVVNTLLITPNKRKALEGTAQFYHKLHGINSEESQQLNPIFYVSNSPWNLYRYLDYFLNQNHFPEGPVLLRDFRTPYDRTVKPEIAHKYWEIFNIIQMYPHLNFVLIGDCGEKDADIYMDVVEKFPNRILAICLRSVDHAKKMDRIESLFKNYDKVPVCIVHQSAAAEEHARSLNLIA